MSSGTEVTQSPSSFSRSMPDLDGFMVVATTRAIQGIFTIIVLGLSAFVASWWTSFYHTHSPSQVSFLIFTAVWTMLAITYRLLVDLRFSETIYNHRFATLGVESVTMLFWFAGFVALGVFLTNRACEGTVCDCAEAATVFAAFEWVMFAISTFFAAQHVMRAASRDRPRLDPKIQMQEGV